MSTEDNPPPHPLAASTRPSDEAARRAIELHQAQGELLRILAPMDQAARTRVIAAVMCMQSDALSKLVIARFSNQSSSDEESRDA